MSTDTPQSLPLATNHVAGIADALDFSPETRERTHDLAALADNSAGLNRSPTVTAAAAAYTAGLLCNERRTQETVATVADCSVVSIRECYQLLIEREYASDDADADDQRLITDGGLTVDPTTDHYCAECRLVTDRPVDHRQQAHADALDSEVDCYPIVDRLPDQTWLAQPRDMGHHGPHTWMDLDGHRVCSRCDAVQLPASPDFTVHREVATDGGTTDESLGDLLTEAEETKRTLTTAQERQEAVKTELHERVDALESVPGISASDIESLHSKIADGKYGVVREQIDTLREDAGFDSEEKALLADQFADALAGVDATVESVRNALQSLAQDTTASRSELVDYIYSAEAGLTKTQIRDTLAVIDDYQDRRLGTKETARLIAAFDSNLGVRDAKAVLEAIEEHGGDLP